VKVGEGGDGGEESRYTERHCDGPSRHATFLKSRLISRAVP